jgi:MFS transporter, PAT family, beta-lactamase induction signal transducer AmpG
MVDSQKVPWTARLRDPRFRTIFFFGMASGLPSSLVFATLSIWLREEGISRTSIGIIGAVATPYAINFLWAPLVDRARMPGLYRWLGQRCSWIFGCQILLVPAVIAMGAQDPKTAAGSLAVCALLVSLLSATQDVAIDAYRVEILKPDEYGAGAAIAIYGWHSGAFLTGAGGRQRISLRRPS